MRKVRVEFPVYETWVEKVEVQTYEQSSSIQEVEKQLDDWLQESPASRKKVRPLTHRQPAPPTPA